MNERPNGIKGVDEDVVPVGAVLTIGHKGPKGNPTDTDRFFIVSRFEGPDKVRPKHPDFEAFNQLFIPVEHEWINGAKGLQCPECHHLQSDGHAQECQNKPLPNKPQTIHGRLVHATRDGAFAHHLKAQVLVKEITVEGKPSKKQWAHPDKRPMCEGDGVIATRWNGKEFKQIPCPNELCEFRMSAEDRKNKGESIEFPTPCRPFQQLYFRIEWRKGEGLPSPLMKFTSGSWNNVRVFLGFFKYIADQAREMRIENPSLFGLPFTITLAKKTKASSRSAFPVISIAPDGDLQKFLYDQQDQRARYGSALPPPPRVAALTDGRNWEEEKADLDTISPGIPREIVAERME